MPGAEALTHDSERIYCEGRSTPSPTVFQAMRLEPPPKEAGAPSPDEPRRLSAGSAGQIQGRILRTVVLCILVAVLSTRTVSPPLVAFTARFYYPAGDRRTSYHQVYLSDFYGTHRRQLTFGRGDKWGVRWIGKRRIAWLENAVALAEAPRSISFYPAEGARVQIVEFDLATNRRRLVARGRFRAPYEEERLPRGRASYFAFDQPLVENTVPAKEPLLLKAYATKGTQLVLGARVAEPIASTRSEEGEFNVGGVEVAQIDSPGKKSYRSTFPDGAVEIGDCCALKRQGQIYDLGLPQSIQAFWPSGAKERCWCLIGSYAASAGSHEWLYQVDWAKRSAKPVVADVLALDFEGDGGTWAALSGGKETRSLGDARVWAADVVAGDIRTGRRWYIARGLVFGSSVSVQPS